MKPQETSCDSGVNTLPVSKNGVLMPQNSLGRAKLLRILQAMGDAVLVFDRREQILLCNSAFMEFFDCKGDIIGQSLASCFAGLDPEIHQRIVAHLYDKDSTPEEITFDLQPDKRRQVYLLTTIPIEEDGVLTEGVAIFRDMTKEKQIETMRRDFVANVSHELRTPLSAINGYAETLLDGALQDGAVARDFVQVIFNHSQRLSALVRDLLDLSKLDSAEYPSEFNRISLVSIAEKVLQLNQKILEEKQIRLHLALPKSLPPVLGHEGPVEQVLTNLVDNAIKYTPHGGAIRIRAVAHPDEVQLDVEDTGIGIEAKHIPRLFERFYRVDKARSRDLGGTGLGLSIVKHIVQYHGGDVWVKSTPGKGTTFSFTLRVAPAE